MDGLNPIIDAMGGGAVATLIALLIGACVWLLKSLIACQSARVADNKAHTAQIIDMFGDILDQED